MVVVSDYFGTPFHTIEADDPAKEPADEKPLNNLAPNTFGDFAFFRGPLFDFSEGTIS